MATIKDVARLANVSIATVSRVINHSPKAGVAAREAVRKAMDELGYRPNVITSYSIHYTKLYE